MKVCRVCGVCVWGGGAQRRKHSGIPCVGVAAGSRMCGPPGRARSPGKCVRCGRQCGESRCVQDNGANVVKPHRGCSCMQSSLSSGTAKGGGVVCGNQSTNPVHVAVRQVGVGEVWSRHALNQTFVVVVMSYYSQPRSRRRVAPRIGRNIGGAGKHAFARASRSAMARR